MKKNTQRRHPCAHAQNGLRNNVTFSGENKKVSEWEEGSKNKSLSRRHHWCRVTRQTRTVTSGGRRKIGFKSERLFKRLSLCIFSLLLGLQTSLEWMSLRQAANSKMCLWPAAVLGNHREPAASAPRLTFLSLGSFQREPREELQCLLFAKPTHEPQNSSGLSGRPVEVEDRRPCGQQRVVDDCSSRLD